MARTIKLKESELTNIIRTISESQLLTEKWVLKPWVKQVITIGNAIGGIIAAYGWLFSDSRLKKNIRRVGKSPSGIPIYEFEYKNKARYGRGTFRGVLAEQVPRRAVRVANNGYKMVNYNAIDVAFEKVNPNKSIKLSERDLSRVVKRVINEQRRISATAPGEDMAPNPDIPHSPIDEFDPWSDPFSPRNTSDPMGDVDVDGLIDMLAPLQSVVQEMDRDIQAGRNNPGWDGEMAGFSTMIAGFIQDAYNELTRSGTITQGTYDTGVLAKNIFIRFFHWVRGLFMHEVPDPPATTTSDVRLKENINKTGVSESGIPIYTFNYKNDNQLWSGTMAQDLLNMGKEDAVTIMENGYYGVNYNMIDVDMVRKN